MVTIKTKIVVLSFGEGSLSQTTENRVETGHEHLSPVLKLCISVRPIHPFLCGLDFVLFFFGEQSPLSLCKDGKQ